MWHIKEAKFVVYLVYPNQPMLCCVGLFQHIQFKVLVPNLSVPHSVITRWTLCTWNHEDHQNCSVLWRNWLMCVYSVITPGCGVTHWPLCRPGRSGSSTSCTWGSWAGRASPHGPLWTLQWECSSRAPWCVCLCLCFLQFGPSTGTCWCLSVTQDDYTGADNKCG